MRRVAVALAGAALLLALTNLAIWRMVSAAWLAKNNSHGFEAVSTAAAFALLGGALMLRLLFAETRWTQLTVWAAAALVAAGGLHVFIGRTAGQFVSWEAWLNSAGPVSGEVIQMQRVTAVLMILSAFSLWALTLRESHLPWLKETGVTVAVVVALLCFLSVLSAGAGNPIFSRTELLKMGVVTALDFCVFNCALLLSVSHTGRLRRLFFGVYEAEDLPPLLRDDRTAFGVLGLATVVILAGIVAYLRVQTGQLRRQIGAELQVAAELKADQLTAWRQERMGDARALASIPDLPQILESLRDGHVGPDRREKLERWLKSFARIYDYDRVVLLDKTMTPMLAGSGGSTPGASYLGAQLRTIAAGGADVLTLPPTVNEAGELGLDFLSPLPGPAGHGPIGAVLLQTKPGASILSVLQVWPHGNQTGQFVLWRREGNRLYSLGGLRAQAGLNDANRRPFSQVRNLDDSGLLIARVAAGDTSVLEGTDVRGIPIIGLGRMIPGTDWLLTCRVDASEIYAPLRRSAWQVVGGTLAVFGGVGFFLTRRLRHRQFDLYRERIVAELAQKRTAARLGAVMGHARDVMLILSANFRIIEVNQCAVDTYGWSAEELCRMHVRDLRSTDSRVDFEEVSSRVRQQAGDTFETEQRRRDGTIFPVEVSVSHVEIDARPHYFSIIRDITERKRAEEALHATEERYRLIAQNTSDVIWLTDLRSGVFTYVSPSIEAALGWRPAEAIGRKVGDFVRLADDLRTTIQARVAAFNAGDLTQRHKRYELEMIHRDGGFRPAENSSTILVDAGGQAAMLLSVNRDISERKRAEAELRVSEERYRLIAENTSDVIWLYDLSADGFSYVSPSVFAQRGYRPEELMGHPLTYSLPADAAQRVSDALEKEFSAADATSRRNFNLEIDQRHKDGRLVPTEVVASLLRDASGRPTHLLGITRDITERKQARETLLRFNAELEERVTSATAEIRGLLDSIPDTVLLCDAAGTVVFSHLPPPSARPAPIARCSDDAKWLGRDPAMDDLIQRMLAAALAGAGTVLQDFDFTQDGRVVTIEARATAISATRVLLLLGDVTTRKKVERDMLANLDRERQLSEMKSRFVSVASHEFRTPLAAAMGSLELLEKHLPHLAEQKRTELLSRTRQSLARLAAIIGNVLSLSRADSGRVAVKRMSVDVGRFLRDIVQEAETADRGQHPVSFQLSGGPETVPADTNLLHHIVSNLLGNAMRYSPAGSPINLTLEIAATQFIVTIADEGIGVPQKERERIFEPFMRGSNVGQIGGTGLGLNIVKRYTELMGGRIELLDAARGASFRVTIPLTQPIASSTSPFS
jgi:PAS domain S-box-containing protein